MPVVQAGYPGGAQRGPSTFDKLKMGAMMGSTVGAIMGFIYGLPISKGVMKLLFTSVGTVTIFQYGAGPNGVMRTIGKYMLGSGATFGVFMSVGSVIRTDSPEIYSQAYARAKYPPIILPRRDIYRAERH
ncbi:MAG: hypothetical protein Q9227_001147 [Pyrenula ochraceoflavens]